MSIHLSKEVIEKLEKDGKLLTIKSSLCLGWYPSKVDPKTGNSKSFVGIIDDKVLVIPKHLMTSIVNGTCKADEITFVEQAGKKVAGIDTIERSQYRMLEMNDDVAVATKGLDLAIIASKLAQLDLIAKS